MTIPADTRSQPSPGSSQDAIRRVLITHGHFLFREGIHRILSPALPRTVFLRSKDSTEAVEHLRSSPCNMVVMHMPRCTPKDLEFMDLIKRNRPSPKLVLLSERGHWLESRILRTRVSLHLPLDSSPDRIVTAVRRLLECSSSRECSTQRLIAQRSSHQGRELSVREKEITRMIAGGKSIKEAAFILKLSPSTVTTYKARVYHKLGVGSDIELTKYALIRGWAA